MQRHATALTIPCAAHGVIGTKGDVDQFKFTATKGQFLIYVYKLVSLGRRSIPCSM